MKKYKNWHNMPEFIPESKNPYRTLDIEFTSETDIEHFSNLIEQKITKKTKSIWYPKLERDEYFTKRYKSNNKDLCTMKYPIYIPSKGRWDVRLTSDTLIRMDIKHFMIVEEHQYDLYKQNVDENYVKLLILPQKYLDEYETCDDLGVTRSKGPGAARNFAWDHSISLGYKRHWVMDDNQRNFYRLNGNQRTIVSDGAIFRAMEDHADQYSNVWMSGPHYRFFAIPSSRLPPFSMNTRIYSCNLILNEIPFRWRGRYNEDTDLSIRILKKGGCTLQYYAFLTGKLVTQAVKGGNTEEFYSKEGTLPKSQMLRDLHPDVAVVKWHFNRWHHYVDYSKFKDNKLIKIDNTIIDSVNNYGMELINI